MRQSTIIATLISALLTIIVWLMLAPNQLGGQVTYVIVDGNSMEAKFHLGDLLLMREAPQYGIGDAVTYQNAELGRFVFHRIIDLNLDRFILKGDNNTWTDTYQPTRDEIIGKLWIHIPKLGKVIEWLRRPVNLSIAVGLLGGSMMYGTIQPRKKVKSNRKLPASSGGGLEIMLYGIGFLALTFLGLTIYAFTRPVFVSAGSLSYQQEGNFFYSAAGAPGIYDTDKVRSGEPIFPRLTCYMNIGYSYNLSSTRLEEVSGRHQLYARVLDEKSGWQRTLPMTAENAFNGTSFLTMSTLDLCQVQALVNMVEQETGLSENTYTLEIVARVATAMRIDSQPVSDTFEPALRLKFDDVHFYLASSSSQEDPLRFSKQGLVEGTTQHSNTLSVLGFHTSIIYVRFLSLAGLLMSLLVLAGLGWIIFRGSGDDRDALIRLKYRSLLMDVQEYGLENSSPLVDVNTIDDLARLAERQNTVILHMSYPFSSYYLVQAQGMTYRYVTDNRNGSIVEVEPPRRQIVDRIGRTGGYGTSGDGVVAGNSLPKTQSISQADQPKKIILRYTLNSNGNADLDFDSDGS